MGKTLTFLSLAALVASAKAAAVDLTEADFDQQVLESGKVRARVFRTRFRKRVDHILF